VLAEGVVVGRIFRAAASPEGSPWMWALAFGRANTKQSAPSRRIGTFGLAVGAACAFSLAIAGQVLT